MLNSINSTLANNQPDAAAPEARLPKFAAVQTWCGPGRSVSGWLDPTVAQPISAIARDPAPPQP
jgi:hypothetical protein